MEVYVGKYAELYDIFYAGKDYKQEASVLHTLIQKYGIKNSKTIFEIACGTGNHAIEFAQLGYNVFATDYSNDMIKQARQKVYDKNLSIQFEQMDMTNIQTNGKTFDCVLCMFDALGYVVSNENIHKTIGKVYNILNPNGLFVFDFWSAGAMLKSFDPYREKFFTTPTGEQIKRISKTEIDYLNQTAKVNYSVTFINNREIVGIEETHINRYFLPQEINLFLQVNGLQLISFYDGFSNSKEINENTWHILCVAKRN